MALAGKTRSSPGTGATPPTQFPGVVQNLSPRNWPIHVFVSARAGAGVRAAAPSASSTPRRTGPTRARRHPFSGTADDDDAATTPRPTGAPPRTAGQSAAGDSTEHIWPPPVHRWGPARGPPTGGPLRPQKLPAQYIKRQTAGGV